MVCSFVNSFVLAVSLGMVSRCDKMANVEVFKNQFIELLKWKRTKITSSKPMNASYLKGMMLCMLLPTLLSNSFVWAVRIFSGMPQRWIHFNNPRRTHSEDLSTRGSASTHLEKRQVPVRMYLKPKLVGLKGPTRPTSTMSHGFLA